MSEAYELYRRTVRACQRCTARRDAREPVPCAYPFGGTAEDRPPVLVVGRNPGREEDRAGEPFVGPAGRRLGVWLQSAGLDREFDVVITNLIKCHTAGNREPTRDEVAACRPYLRAEIAMFEPELIIVLGAQAVREIMGHDLKTARGRMWRLAGSPALHYATYHPSAALRSAKMNNEFLSDAELVRRWWEDRKGRVSAQAPR